ncbi:hypothetical protein FRC09_014073 [Ceratobasidium sp. 395]|nr:hypothetical protein FRC09_014073 [Ceratobasidium sp. 395]
MARADTTVTKNIWIAAGDGDLARVKELVEEKGMSPNAPDDVIGYTPMHAAASYGHLNILEYLIEKGGDVNVTDEEGDTPLYTAESVTVAQFLVEHGAQVDIKNSEDISPAEATEEDFPEVAAYIRSKSSLPQPPPEVESSAQDQAPEEMTAALIAETEEIITRAEREGRDPHDELTTAVGRTVLGGMAWAALQQQQDQGQNREDRDVDMPER